MNYYEMFQNSVLCNMDEYTLLILLRSDYTKNLFILGMCSLQFIITYYNAYHYLKLLAKIKILFYRLIVLNTTNTI